MKSEFEAGGKVRIDKHRYSVLSSGPRYWYIYLWTLPLFLVVERVLDSWRRRDKVIVSSR